MIPILWIGVHVRAFQFMRKAKPGGFYFADLWYEFFMGLVPPTVLISFRPRLDPARLGNTRRGRRLRRIRLDPVVGLLPQVHLSGFYDALIKTLEITVLIMFLVAASNFFGAVFSNLGTPKMLTELLLALDLRRCDRCPDHGADLPAWLAARMGADRADHRADPAASGELAGFGWIESTCWSGSRSWWR